MADDKILTPTLRQAAFRRKKTTTIPLSSQLRRPRCVFKHFTPRTRTSESEARGFKLKVLLLMTYCTRTRRR